jgi:hypothetical protein
MPAQEPERLESLSTGSLEILGSPASASVFVDGTFLGDLARGSLEVRSPAGEVVVRIEADGFVPQERSVRVEADTVTRVEIELAAAVSSEPGTHGGEVDPQEGTASAAVAAARVMLRVEPSDARAFVDGVEVGREFELPAGRYGLVVRAEGFVPESLDLVVEAGGVIERAVVLPAGRVERVSASTSAGTSRGGVRSPDVGGGERTTGMRRGCS